jgi:hypothetical protein
MLQLDKDGKLEELDRLDAEYTFLTKTLGWKEGLEESENTKQVNEAQVKCLAQYLLPNDFPRKGRDCHSERTAANP